MHEVLSELEQLRKRSHRLIVVQRVAIVIACFLAVGLVLGAIDYLLRFPALLRTLFLLGGLAVLGLVVWRWLRAAFKFRPPLTQLALRVESAVPALSGRLASSVEFAMAGVDEANPLARRSIRETQNRLTGTSIGSIIQPGRTLRYVGAMALAIVVVVAIAIAQPAMARTGAMRLLLPFAGAEWPARTAVESLMTEVLPHAGVHPRGEALLLRARNLTSGGEAEPVDAFFRYHNEGRAGDWERVILTHQANGLHERRIAADADRVDVYFATEDARTRVEAIQLVPPPAVVRAVLTVEPPAYARDRATVLEVDLGPGLDERAATETGSLIGSQATMRFELNKPLPTPETVSDDWVRSTFGWEGEHTPTVTFGDAAGEASDTWTMSWTLRGDQRLELTLADEHGLTNRDPIEYRIDAVQDLPPSVTVTEPSRDETVLPTAVITVAGEATDDVAVAEIGLAYAVQRGTATVRETLPDAPSRAVDAATATIEADLELSGHDLHEGDIVFIEAVASDHYELDGDHHAPTRSTVRRLRVIGELEFAAQIRRQLSAVRQNAIRMESIQGELQDDLAEDGMQPGLQRGQAQLGERIADQRAVIDELREAIDQNQLDDEQLRGLLDQSGDLLEYAGRAASRAMEALEALPMGEAAEDLPEEPRRATDEAQQEVRDELGDLIELLDRDEDTWMVQRQIEGLIEAQARLERETSELAQETIGEDLAGLSEEEREALERIGQEQRNLRDQARQLLEEIRRRAEALEEFDPQAASGMRSAADTGEQREVDRDMEQAAQRAEQNQLQSARAAQQSASATLQRMLDDIQETKRARAEELLRQLASLIESIDRLIAAQENEIIALARAVEDDDFTGRDRAMIRLNQNTKAVAGEARAAGQESRRIARALDRAADAQGEAVTALRAEPLDAEGAGAAEERALELLKEAKTLTEELQERTEEEQVRQQREELVAAYRELAEKQVQVREQTLGLSGKDELSRRELVEARTLGNAQDEIRKGLVQMQDNTRELLDSDIFRYVHELMDGWADEASAALWDGRADIDVTDRQRMIAESIGRQIEALEELLAPPDEFEEESGEGEGAAGGGSGQQPLIPPVAELRRVQSLQEQVYDMTRDVDERTDLGEGQRRQRVRELGEMQRELVEIGERILESLVPDGSAGPDAAPTEDDGEAGGAGESRDDAADGDAPKWRGAA